MGSIREPSASRLTATKPSTIDDAIGEFAESGVVVSSRERASWRGVEVMRGRLSTGELTVSGLGRVTIAINLGRAFDLWGEIEGRMDRVTLGKGAALIVPAGAPSEAMAAWRPAPTVSTLPAEHMSSAIRTGLCYVA